MLSPADVAVQMYFYINFSVKFNRRIKKTWRGSNYFYGRIVAGHIFSVAIIFSVVAEKLDGWGVQH